MSWMLRSPSRLLACVLSHDGGPLDAAARSSQFPERRRERVTPAPLLPALALLVLLATSGAAQDAPVTPAPPDFPRGKISGHLFWDLYDNLAGDPRHAYDAAGLDSAQANIDGKKVIGRDLNGVQLRRAYFQVDNDLSIRYSTRFRLEADGKSLTSDGRIGVAVKAAYMQVRGVYPRADLFFGVIATPTFENSEEYGAYRSVEKTLVDFRGLAPAADLGLELKGFVDPNQGIGYALMLGDGNGNKPETNRDKRAYFALPLRWRDLRLEPYVDYENVFNARDRATYKLFAGWDVLRGAIGWEVVDQVAHKSAGAYSAARAHAVFARYAASPTIAGFARADFWQPDRNAADRVDQQLWILGVDWQPLKDVHFLPNLESLQYRAVGKGVVPPHHDLQARVTLYWKFTRPQS